MISRNKAFSPSYNKEHGLTLRFIMSVMLCSTIEEFERQVIYLFHIGNIIDLRTIDRSSLTNDFLLQKILDLSGDKKYITKKDLREITGLHDRSTFNKYFAEHLINCGLSKNRGFTLLETFQVLEFWQGDDKWGRMEAFTKRELAERFMDDRYDNLEFEITNDIIASENYLHHDYIKPADAKKFTTSVLKEDVKALELLNEEEFDIDYLGFFFFIFLFNYLEIKAI